MPLSPQQTSARKFNYKLACLIQKLIAGLEATARGTLRLAKVWSAGVSWGCNKRTSAEGGKMTAFQGIFLSEGTPEGRGPQPQDTPAGRAARSHELLPPLQPLETKPHIYKLFTFSRSPIYFPAKPVFLKCVGQQ